MKNFCTCHSHPESLDSASTLEKMAAREIELETGVFVSTDHGTMQAHRKIYDLCHSKKYKGKLTPILGVEGYFRDDNDPILLDAGIQPNERGSFLSHWKYGHITLHAMDETAWSAMSRILSAADLRGEQHGSERKPLFNWQNLEELGSYNITVGSGCLIGMVQSHIFRHGRPDLAEAYYSRLNSIFKPGNFYAEVFPHICDRYWESGVTITYEDGTHEKFKGSKNLKTDKISSKKNGGFQAEDLAAAWKRNPEGFGSLRAVMQNREWVDITNPKKISKVEAHEGFQFNECTPASPDGDVQLGTNTAILALARKYGNPVLVSDDSHFAVPEEKIVQDIRLSQSGSWRFANSYHRQSSNEAFGYFKDKLNIKEGEFDGWVENSYEWANRFKDFRFTPRKALPTSFYPQDTLRHTLSLIKDQGRMTKAPEVQERLKAEIDLLHYNGTIDLLPYFFIDAEVCDLYLRNNLLTGPGRGSAAGLNLAYLLGITHVDPLRFGLSMDRFMTTDRIESGKYPDIDQDLPNRDLLTHPETGWLKKRFGDCYAQLSVDTTLKLRSAVKDVARWKRATSDSPGFVPAEIEQLAAKFINAPQGITDHDFVFGYTKEGEDVEVEGSINYDPALQEYVRTFPLEWEQVQKVIGLTRQKSRHACAFIIADEPVQNFIPTTSISGVRVTQFTPSSVEAAGGLKMDFLTVNSIGDIQSALKMVQERYGDKGLDWAATKLVHETTATVPFTKINNKKVPLIRTVPLKGGGIGDIWDLPEDQGVFRDLCEAKTETVFQFGTPGAKKWLHHFNQIKGTDADNQTHKGLDSIESIAAFTALDRPGPLDYFVTSENGSKHNMLVEYANRTRGESKAGSLPILDSLFMETLGVIIFQEQLQKAFKDIGQTTAIEANNFRIHVSKKQVKELQKDRAIFLKGALQTLSEIDAIALWESMETFGNYAFNKSHAVCYGVIGYACAFLKHHYPIEWWTAVLTNADKNEINEEFWPYCGHLVKVPDVNLSKDNFSIEEDGIRAPLSLLMGIGPAAHKELSEGVPYKNIEDFCLKIDAKKKIKKIDEEGKEKNGRSTIHSGIAYKLICSGVMDSLFQIGMETPEKLAAYEAVVAKVANKKKPKPVDSKYTNLTALQRYQLKKSILSSFGEDLRSMAASVNVQGLANENGRYTYSYEGYRKKQEIVPVVSANDSFDCQQMMLPEDGIAWAVVAYVVLHETVSFQDGKKMAKILLDVEGKRQEFIKWPDKKGLLPERFKKNMTGCLVVAAVRRYSEDKSPVLDDITIIQDSLVLKETE